VAAIAVVAVVSEDLDPAAQEIEAVIKYFYEKKIYTSFTCLHQQAFLFYTLGYWFQKLISS
jgi:hypothetical protein